MSILGVMQLLLFPEYSSQPGLFLEAFRGKDKVMSTIGDVVKAIQGQNISIELFGASEGYLQEYHQRCGALGQLIAKDLGLPTEKASVAGHLSTELGSDAQMAFDHLLSFIESSVETG